MMAEPGYQEPNNRAFAVLPHPKEGGTAGEGGRHSQEPKGRAALPWWRCPFASTTFGCANQTKTKSEPKLKPTVHN